MKKLALALGVMTVALASVTHAAADDRSGPAAAASLSTLPTGKVAPPPKTKAPGAIPASEKVPGFVVVPQRGGGGGAVNVVASAKAAKQLNEGSRGDNLTGEACFTEDQPAMRRFDDSEHEPTWRPNLQPMLTMSTSAQWGGQRVTAVHSERIAEEGGRVSMEVIDAWVDAQSRGVRLIGRSTVPLELVSTLLGGSKLYAAHDGPIVHVILVTPKDHRRSGQDGLFAIVDEQVFNSSCDHIRATLKSDKGQGVTASFISNVELPSLEPKDKPAEAKPDVPKGLAARFGGVAPKEARVRPMHVQASLTWASREKEPLLSASAGWDSRERTAFVF